MKRILPWTCRMLLVLSSAFLVMGAAGMASAVTASLNKVATLGLAPIVFGPVMNLTASTLQIGGVPTRWIKSSTE